VFEFDLHCGPLHLTLRVTDPETGDGYTDLSTDHELGPDDEDDAPEVGGRGP
jgi:hypothetical protein